MDFDDYKAMADANANEGDKAEENKDEISLPHFLKPEHLRAHPNGGIYYQLAGSRQDMVTFRYRDPDEGLRFVSLQYAVNVVIEYNTEVIVVRFMDKAVIIHGGALDPIYTGLVNRNLLLVYEAQNIQEEAQRYNLQNGQTYVNKIEYYDHNPQEKGIPLL